MPEFEKTVLDYFNAPEFIYNFRDYNPGHFKKLFEPAVPATVAAWEQRRVILKKRIKIALGLYPDRPRTPLNAEIFDYQVFPGFRVGKVRFESMPGFYVTGNIYVPDGDGPFPAILNPHGHWDNGRLGVEERVDVPIRLANLALMGYVAFSHDMVGYLDSYQVAHDAEATPEEKRRGFGLMTLQTINSIRSLDFLESLPFVDKDRFGCVGASGGATQTFILTAVDDRIKACAPVNMISGQMQGGCPCETAPALRVGTNNMEIASLFAPRPMLMTGCTGDWTRNMPYKEYPYVKQIYRLYGAADRVSMFYCDDKHNFNIHTRNAVYDFFAKHLPTRVTEWTEHEAPMGDYNRFRLYKETPKPGGDYEKVSAAHKDFITDQLRSIAEEEKLEILAESFGFYDAPCGFRTKVVKTGKTPEADIEYRVFETQGYVRCLPHVRLSFGTEGKNVLILAETPEAAMVELSRLRESDTGISGAVVAALYPRFDGVGGRRPTKQELLFFDAFNRTADAIRTWETASLLSALSGWTELVRSVGRTSFSTAAALAARPDISVPEVVSDLSGVPTPEEFFVPAIDCAGEIRA